MKDLNRPESEVPMPRRRFLLLPLAAMASYVTSSSLIAAEPDAITSREVDEGCPLNSGGPSLLNTQWRVESVYGNRIPQAVDMKITVNKNSLTGSTGCNPFTASFQQVGYTGFRVTNVNKGGSACEVIRPVEGGPTINVGDLQGGFLRTLRRMGSVQQVQSRLVFYNRNGNKGIIMRRA